MDDADERREDSPDALGPTLQGGDPTATYIRTAGLESEPPPYWETSSESDFIVVRDETGTQSAILGDATIASRSSGAFVDSTTLIWIRPYAP